jgi:hypothetical protein
MTQDQNSNEVFVKHKDSLPLNIFPTAARSGEMMLILLPSVKSHTLQHCLPQMQTVNDVYYVNTLKIHLRNTIWKIHRVLDKTVVSASRQCAIACM